MSNPAIYKKRQSPFPTTDMDGAGHITILPYSYHAIGQGTWVSQIVNTQFLNGHFINSSTTNGDNIDYKVYLAKGTYSLIVFTDNHTGRGIVDIDIDGVEVASFDLYAGSLAYNIRNIETGIVIALDGLKTIKLRVDGKNASSSNYGIYISYLALIKTT